MQETRLLVFHNKFHTPRTVFNGRFLDASRKPRTKQYMVLCGSVPAAGLAASSRSADPTLFLEVPSRRNSAKFEFRSTKLETNLKHEKPKPETSSGDMAGFGFRISCLFRFSIFEFRILAGRWVLFCASLHRQKPLFERHSLRR